MKRPVFLFLAMGCIGVTTEVFFTAISNVVMNWGGAGFDRSLRGHSYLYMFPIYGLAGLLLPPVMLGMERVPFVVRALIYGVGIMAVEFVCGAVLEAVTGRCPWEYHARLAVMGYIRLDYYPFWVVFGAGVERVVGFLQGLIKGNGAAWE